MVKTLHFCCRGHRFNPWLGNEDPACHAAWPGKQKHQNKSESLLPPHPNLLSQVAPLGWDQKPGNAR